MEVFSLNSSFSMPSVKPKEFKVDFVNVRDRYTHDSDLICTYVLDGHRAQEGDRVAIFKLGWSYVREYLLFEWAPVTSDSLNSVTFSRFSLPKNTDDMYQFCYITHENEVLGASPLFQFGEGIILLQNLILKETAWTPAHKEKKLKEDATFDCASPAGCNSKSCQQLREENLLLRESLKAILLNGNRKSGEFKELKELVLSLRDVVNAQQNEIGVLKREISKTKAKTVETVTASDHDFEIGELESMPPFPFAKQ